MNLEEKQYLDLLSKIINEGSEKKDRTGIGTKSIFGTQLRFSLENNKIPMLTTKKMFSRGIIEELLFFIRGNTNTKLLEEKGVNIWKGNTSREFLDKRGLNHYPEGEMGPMYGSKWRNFNGVDQLKNCLDLIKNDPDSRRILITAYDPSASKDCVLDPCHLLVQFYVDNGKLSCQFQMRSTDYFLGFPFNAMSYAILTHIMAKAVGLEAKELIFVGGDTHIYNNHLTQVKEQISRKPFDFPTLNINKEISNIEDMENLKFEDFKIIGYQSHPAIKAPMAV
jgi:thymidylate synthase